MGILIIVVLLLILAVRGWQRGVVRQGLSLISLIVALAVGYWAYQSGGETIASALGIPRLFGGASIAFFLGFIAYCCIAIPSAILFKNTGQQTGVVRLFYGLGGALCGAGMGAIVLWGVFSVFPYAQTSKRSSRETGWFSRIPQTKQNRLVTLEKSTDSAYETFLKVQRVVSDQRAMIRFLRYPEVRRVMETRAVSELMRTPEFSEAVSRQEVVKLLFNAKLYQAMRDPEVKAAIRDVNFNNALDYALRTK